MKLGLKTKLLAVISLLLLAIVIILQGMSIRLTTTALEELKTNELQNIVTQTTSAIEISLDGARRVVETVSVSDEVLSLMEKLESGQPAEPEALLRFFAGIDSIQDDIETVIFLSSAGVVLADNENGGLVGLNLSDSDYYNALRYRKMDNFLGEINTSPATGNKVIVYAQRLFTPQNSFAGVTAVVLDFESFIESLVSAINAGETGVATLIDSEGIIVYSPNPEILGENLLETAPNSQLKPLTTMLNENTEVTGRFREEGTERIFFAAPVSNWFLILTVDQSEYMAAANAIRNSGIVLGLIFIILGGLCALFFANRIANPILKISAALGYAGQGDLTQSVQVDNQDEVGDLANSLNAMISGQREILLSVLAASQNVASYSEELSASVQESNASMQEIANTVDIAIALKAQEISLSSTAAMNSSDEMRSRANDGESAVQDAVNSMAEINRATQDVNIVINELNGASEQIGTIVVTITEIAEQTNLLALNAAIEAARAGEQGRGFAVVAEEVRKLAEQSSRAAGEIGNLIVNIQKKTGSAVNKINDAGTIVEIGASRAGRALESLAQIHAAADAVREQIQLIAQQAEAQSASAQEISAGTEEQTTVLEEIANTSNQLASMADELNKLVLRFNL